MSNIPSFMKVDIDGEEIWRRDLDLIDDDIEPKVSDVECIFATLAQRTAAPELAEMTPDERVAFSQLRAPLVPPSTSPAYGCTRSSGGGMWGWCSATPLLDGRRAEDETRWCGTRRGRPSSPSDSSCTYF